MTQLDVELRLYDEPFRTFRLHLSEGTIVEVPDPRLVMVSPTTVVLPARFRRGDPDDIEAMRWRTVALSHVVMFSDLADSPQSR